LIKISSNQLFITRNKLFIKRIKTKDLSSSKPRKNLVHYENKSKNTIKINVISMKNKRRKLRETHKRIRRGISFVLKDKTTKERKPQLR